MRCFSRESLSNTFIIHLTKITNNNMITNSTLCYNTHQKVTTFMCIDSDRHMDDVDVKVWERNLYSSVFAGLNSILATPRFDKTFRHSFHLQLNPLSIWRFLETRHTNEIPTNFIWFMDTWRVVTTLTDEIPVFSSFF